MVSLGTTRLPLRGSRRTPKAASTGAGAAAAHSAIAVSDLDPAATAAHASARIAASRCRRPRIRSGASCG